TSGAAVASYIHQQLAQPIHSYALLQRHAAPDAGSLSVLVSPRYHLEAGVQNGRVVNICKINRKGSSGKTIKPVIQTQREIGVVPSGGMTTVVCTRAQPEWFESALKQEIA